MQRIQIKVLVIYLFQTPFRFRTLGAGYSEDEIKAVIAGDAEHCPHQKQPPKEKPFNLLVDVQAKLAEGKNIGYARWAKKYNLKEMSKTLIFLQEKKIGSIEEMQERVDAATARYHELGDSIKAAETRMTEIAVLRTHIVNYTKTRPVYDENGNKCVDPETGLYMATDGNEVIGHIYPDFTGGWVNLKV